MCGIAGALYFNNNRKTIEKQYINSIRDVPTMVLRGPDGAGTWITESKKLALAHRRLSIIDLSERAAQPMTNSDESVVLTYNGEIYNHKEIRTKLDKLNKYKWKTDHSDTEVVLHAYEEWGMDCIKEFRGMFAFAIWDGRTEELYLVRDRMGIKPLYYTKQKDRFIFASDINAILADKEVIRAVDEKAMYNYLSFLVSPAPFTLFKGISKLENATILKVNLNGDISKFRYWDMFDNKVNVSELTEAEICEMMVEEFRISVQIHKESDVPTGVFLSGGIDSSLNALLFSENERDIIKTFTISFDSTSNYTNEDDFAKELSKSIGAEHFIKKVSIDDIMGLMTQLIKYLGEPLADPVSGAQFYVSQLARENDVTVCQVGEGMDELYVGYPTWISFHKYISKFKVAVPPIMKKLLYRILRLYYGKTSLEAEWLRRFANGNLLFWGTNDIFTHEYKKVILSDRLNKKFKNYSSWEVVREHYNRFKRKNNSGSIYDWMAYIDLNLRFPDLLLPKVDKMGMAVSLEARVPYLDHKVVELAMSLKERVKMKNPDETKYLLKKALSGMLPDDVLYRKKIGFVLPINDWYNGEFKKAIQKSVLEFVDKVDYFKKSEVEKVLDGSNKLHIWVLYTLALWYNTYFSEYNSAITKNSVEYSQ